MTSQFTYVCDQTLDPKWLNQKFLFDINPRAHEDIRKYSVKILVKSKSLAGVDQILAKADIPFTCLKGEQFIEGWFPLRPPSNNVIMTHKTSGSIKLKLQWIHSEYGFANYILDQTNRYV